MISPATRGDAMASVAAPRRGQVLPALDDAREPRPIRQP